MTTRHLHNEARGYEPRRRSDEASGAAAHERDASPEAAAQRRSARERAQGKRV